MPTVGPDVHAGPELDPGSPPATVKTPSRAAPREGPTVMSDQTVMSDKPSVLFVCVHNAGRSQMAAAYLHHRRVEDACPKEVLPRARHASDPHRLLRQDERVFGASQHLEEPHALQKRRKAPLLADLVEPLLALAGIDLLSKRLGVIPADVAHQ